MWIQYRKSPTFSNLGGCNGEEHEVADTTHGGLYNIRV